MYMGLRQTSDMDDAKGFLLHLEKNCMLVLAGILQPDRVDYFKQFITRRTGLVINSLSAQSSAS
jgi:hypothetical protein